MNARWIRVLDIALRLAAGMSVLLAGLWVLGPNGTSTVGVPFYGDALRPLYGTSLLDWGAQPRLPVLITDYDEVGSVLYAANQGLQPVSGLIEVGEGGADLYAGVEIGIYDPATAPGLAHLGLHVLTLLALAWVLWSLARLVGSSRTASPFTARNATMLTRVGLMVGGGGLLLSVARHLVDVWLVETTTRTGDLVAVFDFGLDDLPYGSLLVGACVLSLAQVWRRGVAMADDLVGLV